MSRRIRFALWWLASYVGLLVLAGLGGVGVGQVELGLMMLLATLAAGLLTRADPARHG